MQVQSEKAISSIATWRVNRRVFRVHAKCWISFTRDFLSKVTNYPLKGNFTSKKIAIRKINRLILTVLILRFVNNHNKRLFLNPNMNMGNPLLITTKNPQSVMKKQEVRVRYPQMMSDSIALISSLNKTLTSIPRNITKHRISRRKPKRMKTAHFGINQP